jgi:hypothetical protein
MRSEPEMRMPYGPGWEDPDWAPRATPPEASTGIAQAAERSEARPVVASLAEFMAVVKRVATPRRRPLAASPARQPLAPAGATRRWVVAGTAGFVALAALPRAGGPHRDVAANAPEDAPPPADEPHGRA